MTSGPYAVRIATWFESLRFDSLPSAVVLDTKLRILDILGIALEASSRPIGRAICEGALALGQGDEASLIGFPERAPLSIAALVNGTLAHATDFDDTHIPSVMHTSAPVVATALACAEATDQSGRELITWVAGANELNCRLGAVAPGSFHARGFHPTSVLGVVTASLIAGRALGLTRPSLVSAMGITGSQAAGLLESYQDGTFVKTLHPGWAAHCGIAAARLVQAGFTGPATVLEGRFGIYRSHLGHESELDFDQLMDHLGKDWLVQETAFKPYPCAQAIHPYVDAILTLRDRAGLRPEDVAKIILPVAVSQHPIICEPRPEKLRPRTPTHARASLFFAVAAALCRGDLAASAFDEAALSDPSILELAARSEHIADPTPSPRSQFRGEVIVETHNGSRLHQRQEHGLGTRENPMGRRGVEEKFRRNAAARLEPRQIDEIADLVFRLDALPRAREVLSACQAT